MPRLLLLCVGLCWSIHVHAAEPDAATLIARYGLEEAAQPVRERAGWRKPRRVLIDAAGPGRFSAIDPEALAGFKAAAPGVEIVIANGDPEQASNVDAYIGVCSPWVLDAGKSIRWIQTLNTGVEDCVSIPALRERNVLLTNMQRTGGPVMAEHVMAMVLAFTRGLDVFIGAQPQGRWMRGSVPVGRLQVVDGKTMLVVGLGGIGTAVAQRAHAMGMRVIATRATSRDGPEFVQYVGLPDELPKLAAQADFIVMTAPLTVQTTRLFDAAFFARMKPSAFFINVARGGSVVTDDLVSALRERRIAGAGLDVTEPEPLPSGHPLWRMPNVIITPHVSNDANIDVDVRVAVATENLRRYVAGEKMLSVVDVARGY
jgi:phosphoglycerate dehydrogenase-like enzyme